MKMLKAECDFRLEKNANFSKRRNEGLPLKKHSGQKKCSVVYVVGAYSVWNNHDDLLLKNFVCTIQLKMQFLTCHKLAVFFRQTSIEQIFIPMV